VSPRCVTCGDSHRVWFPALNRYIPCRRCPSPCSACAGKGPATLLDAAAGVELNAYCVIADCRCACHQLRRTNARHVPPSETPPPPEPPTRDELVDLLRRWRDLDGEPQPGEGLVSDDEVLTAHAAWREVYDALTDATDKALAAEGRQPGGEVATP